MRSRGLLAAVLIVSASLRLLGDFLQGEHTKVKVRSKVQPRAFAFDLRHVRLLDGPFREAMLRPEVSTQFGFRPAAAHVPR
jgi:hypothetical protein